MSSSRWPLRVDKPVAEGLRETRLQRFCAFLRQGNLRLDSADQSCSDNLCFMFTEVVYLTAAVPVMTREETLQFALTIFAVQFGRCYTVFFEDRLNSFNPGLGVGICPDDR